DRDQRRPTDGDPDRRQYRRSADPGRLALSFLRNEHRTRLRSRTGARLPARYPGRDGDTFRAGTEPRGQADRLRLVDTDLVIEIESDRTIYGEEVKFGGGKVIRDGMGQSQATRAEGAVDTVITNA